MRVSDHFTLGRTQPFLDFVDVRLDTDIPVFLDPSAIRVLKSTWGHECASLLQHYFTAVLQRIKNADHNGALALLSCLNERNEFHLGYSSQKSRGHAFGTKSAESVWEALTQSQASVSGLLKDLEDACLLIDGIGKDMVSDAVCNILRGPFIKYTQDMCRYYGIPLTPGVASGPVWDPHSGDWEQGFVSLPITSEGKLVLVPKIMVRHRVTYRADEYYNHFLLPEMQKYEKKRGSSLVHLLKNGTARVTKKDLKAKYGSDKLAIVTQTIRHPHVLDEYKEEKNERIAPPLEHEDFAAVEATNRPDWESLLSTLQALPTGTQSAGAYEDIIEKIISALFYPSLCKPQKQHRIHDGRKRVDITYSNEARDGFFAWLSLHYSSALVFVECKNYGKEIGNPELDQLSSRFSPSRGQVGILVCRSVADYARLLLRCADTAKDHRGYILVLTDQDLETLIRARQKEPLPHEFPLLRERFMPLIN